MKSRAGAASAAAFSAVAFAWGCNAILGNSDGNYVDAGDSTNDGAPLGDATSDTSAGDAAPSDAPFSDGRVTDGGTDACTAVTATDPRNCGSCGHDCLQGTCVSSVCQPFVLVGDAAAPERIVLTPTTIYFASLASNTINRVGLDGTGNQEILAPGSSPPNAAIAVDPAGIYYTASPGDGGNQELRQCPLSGPCVPAVIGSFLGPAGDVAADGVNIYASSPSSKIFSIRESDHQSSLLVSTALSLAQVVAAPPFVYWGDNANRVSRIGSDGTDGGFFVNTVGSATYIQVRGARLAWAGSSGSTSNYGTCDVSNCSGTKLNLVRSEDATGVDVDATTLYWVTRGSAASNGTVNSCSLADSCASVKTRAIGQAQPVAMGVTTQAIYWVNKNGGGMGAVMGVAK